MLIGPGQTCRIWLLGHGLQRITGEISLLFCLVVAVVQRWH